LVYLVSFIGEKRMNNYLIAFIGFVIGFILGGFFAYKIHDNLVAAKYRTKQIMKEKFNYES